MAELTYRDAVARGIAQEMTRDPDVVFLGEDVAKAGGVFKATVGLYEQFGPLRVRDTPISEQAIMGAAIGLYLFKIIALAVAVKLLGDASFFNGKLFGVTALVCILAYCAAQMTASIRHKTLYVNPDGER